MPSTISPSVVPFSSCLQSFPASRSVFGIRWPKYWSFSFNISPSNEYSRRISFSIDWLDLLAVQGTLKSLLHHHNLKALIWYSIFCKFRLSSKRKALPDDWTRKRWGSEHLGWQPAPIRSNERQSGNRSQWEMSHSPESQRQSHKEWQLQPRVYKSCCLDLQLVQLSSPNALSNQPLPYSSSVRLCPPSFLLWISATAF